ncbi:endolytic transglycosylase MltG [Candidatus Woesebacteria bacterium]|nr:endolytic transglycosylase MltG [Candidatus Woesebacteria bacterium]
MRFSLLFFGIFIVWALWSWITSPLDPSASFNAIAIKPGSSVKSIANTLKANNLIRSETLFVLYVRFNDIKLKAGDYTLSPSQSIPELAQALTTGRENEIRVTIPEGYRREQISEVIESKLGIKQLDFLSASKGLEGTLFPDTYAFSKDATANDVVKVMTDTFAKKTAILDLTQSDIVLASIVEREALTPAEKPVVAGILKNRLADGWALEVDATIQYIMGKSGDWWPVPLLGDRKRVSPYNTYLNRTLPPAPIGNPGIIALTAVANPATTPYYFYLHDKTGLIHYAATNAEHEANIAKYINK